MEDIRNISKTFWIWMSLTIVIGGLTVGFYGRINLENSPTMHVTHHTDIEGRLTEAEKDIKELQGK